MGVDAEQTLYYKSKSQDVIVDNEAFTPSFVMDDEGNGSLLFERRILQMENNNIRYFGHAAP